MFMHAPVIPISGIFRHLLIVNSQIRIYYLQQILTLSFLNNMIYNTYDRGDRVCKLINFFSYWHYILLSSVIQIFNQLYHNIVQYLFTIISMTLKYYKIYCNHIIYIFIYSVILQSSSAIFGFFWKPTNKYVRNRIAQAKSLMFKART